MSWSTRSSALLARAVLLLLMLHCLCHGSAQQNFAGPVLGPEDDIIGSDTARRYLTLADAATALGVTSFLRALELTRFCVRRDYTRILADNNVFYDDVATVITQDCTRLTCDACVSLLADLDFNTTEGPLVLAPSNDAMAEFIRQDDTTRGLNRTIVTHHITYSLYPHAMTADVYGALTLSTAYTAAAGADGSRQGPQADWLTIAPQNGGYMVAGAPDKVAYAANEDCVRFGITGTLCKITAVTVPANSNGFNTALEFLASRPDLSELVYVAQHTPSPTGTNITLMDYLNDTGAFGTFFAPTNDAWSEFYKGQGINSTNFVKTEAAYWTALALTLPELRPSSAVLSSVRDSWLGLNARYVAFNRTTPVAKSPSGINSQCWRCNPTFAPYLPYLIGQGYKDQEIAKLGIKGDFDIPAGSFFVHVINKVPVVCDYLSGSKPAGNTS